MTGWIRTGNTIDCPECETSETVHERRVKNGEDVVNRVACLNCYIIVEDRLED